MISLRSLSTFSLAFVAGLLAAPVPSYQQGSEALQNILQNTHKSNLYTYPTDFTRGITPKQFHSHNDYWRDVPFYSGLSYGAISTEADVWLINGTLYVGHEESALTKERTLESLYLDPIMDTLHRQNPTTPFVDGSETKNGVFDTDAGQTLYLFIDLKTGGKETWPVVLEALEPLRKAGYLTTYDGDTLTTAPVTIIGTGNTPAAAVKSANPRDAFYDAPVDKLSSMPKIDGNISPIASAGFQGLFGVVVEEKLDDDVIAQVKEQVKVAHERNILVRYWDTPGWPIGTRNAFWRQLLDLGCDLINVDDLAGAAAFWENKG